MSNLTEASEIAGIITNGILICGTLGGSLVAAWNWKSIIRIFIRIAQGRASTDEIADARDRLASCEPLRNATHDAERLLHATGHDAQANNLERVDRLAREHRGGDIESISRDPSPLLLRSEMAERRGVHNSDGESLEIRIDNMERFANPRRLNPPQRLTVGTQTQTQPQSQGMSQARSRSAPRERIAEGGFLELTNRPAPGINRIQDGPGGARLKERPGQSSPMRARNGDMAGLSGNVNRGQKGPATGRGLPNHKGGHSGKARPSARLNRSGVQPEA